MFAVFHVGVTGRRKMRCPMYEMHICCELVKEKEGKGGVKEGERPKTQMMLPIPLTFLKIIINANAMVFKIVV